MELRWIEMKNWDKGRYKLQYRYRINSIEERNAVLSDWIDVPVAERSKELGLQEKFDSWIKSHPACLVEAYSLHLARIAEEHFKESK